MTRYEWEDPRIAEEAYRHYPGESEVQARKRKAFILGARWAAQYVSGGDHD